MKTKIKILIVSFVIAAAAVTGFNLAQENRHLNVSLADISVMARADGESGGGGTGSCMEGGGTMVAGAYRCDDPGSPQIPKYNCGTPWWIRTGTKLVTCSK